MPVLSQTPGCNPACRACHYKDLTYEDQLVKKRDWFNRNLGRWENVVGELTPAPETQRLGYRTKSWLRTDFNEQGVSFGMLRARQAETGEWQKELISWDECPLHSEGIRNAVRRLKEAFLEFSESERKRIQDDWVGVWIGSPHVVIVSRAHLSEWARKLDWTKILSPPFLHAWFHTNPQVGRKVFSHLPIEPLTEAPHENTHPIRAFRQVAQTLLIQARASAVEHLLESKPHAVIDLYCGTGELSRLLPETVGWIGIELSPQAVDFAQTLKPGGRPVHEAFTGAIEQRMRDPRFRAMLEAITKEKGRMALYINPPRPGLGEEGRTLLTKLLEEHKPEKIAYLSCSASSLARDLVAIESAGYRIESLKPYDFFPQTEHFETLALLALRA